MLVSELIKQRLDTNLLRFIAVLAVVNSHLDFLYPQGYQFLATGGAIGNSLFFFSSGFGLWFSIKYLNQSAFMKWFGKRCLRIYPPYLIVLPLLVCILLYTGDMNLNRVINIGEFVFFPHQAYWFLQAMILFYILIYIIFSLSEYKEKLILNSICIFCVIYFLSYFFLLDLTVFSIESLPFKLIFYFMCILIGMYISSKNFEEVWGMWASLCCSIFSLFIFLSLKFLMKNDIGFIYQALQHLSILAFIISLFSLSRTSFCLWLRKNKLVGKSIDFISDHSLEIYLVHLPLIFLMRYLNFTNSFYIIPLLIISLFLSALLKVMTKKILVKMNLVSS